VFATNRKSISTVLTVMILSLLLAACGSDNEKGNAAGPSASGSASPSSPEASAIAPSASPTERTLVDGMGHEVKIPANPQRIIASYLEDYLVALGVKPVAQWSVPNGIQDYLQGELKDIPKIAHDLPFEAVASFSPDLVLVYSNSTVDNKYDQYSKIAPTFVLGDQTSDDWRQALLKVGEVLQKDDEAKKVLDAYEAKAAEAKAKIQAKLPGQSVAAIWLVQNSFYVVSDKLSSGAILYHDLGFKTPEVVQEISETGTGNWNAISLEKLADLDADHLILINSDKGTASEALKDPVWKNIPAVKNGKVYEYPSSSSWLYYGPVASTQTLDAVLNDIVK